MNLSTTKSFVAEHQHHYMQSSKNQFTATQNSHNKNPASLISTEMDSSHSVQLYNQYSKRKIEEDYGSSLEQHTSQLYKTTECSTSSKAS